MGKIRQRKKNGPVTFTGTLKLFSEDIEIKIKASAETWWNFFDLYFDPKGPSSISNFFYDEIIREVITFLETKKPRGTHAQSAEFTERMKRYCAYVYCLCEYWLKKPRSEWPDPIKDTITWLETPLDKRSGDAATVVGSLSLIADHTQKIKKPTPSILAAVFAEKFFYEERRPHYKKWTDDFDTFRRTFITNNKRYIKHYKEKILPLLFRRLKKYNRFRKHKMTLPFNTGDLPEIFEAMRKSSLAIS